jgi:16S rRNA (adenine1518-N6/adenine1519-N6)-dimethyltransferase
MVYNVTMYKPIKELGQNFLTDINVADGMVGALDINSGTDLIEIGAGHGILTELLVKEIREKKNSLYVVEIDERFCNKLSQMFLDDPDVKILCEDVLQFLPEFHQEKKVKVIGSLPYYITSPILHKVIKMKVLPETCVFLVQKEVAEKIQSKAPDSSYLSSFVQTFFEVEYLGEVDAKKFNPVPEVDGGIIKLTSKNPEVKFDPEFVEKYEGFLHKAFSHPRKMLNKVFTKEELDQGKIDPGLRAQNLDAEEWLSFFRILYPGIEYEV